MTVLVYADCDPFAFVEELEKQLLDMPYLLSSLTCTTALARPHLKTFTLFGKSTAKGKLELGCFNMQSRF